MFKRKKRRSRTFKNNSQVIDLAEARQARKQRREETARKKDKARRPKSAVTVRQAGKKARLRMVYTAIFLVIVGIVAVSAVHIVNLRLTEAKVMKEHQELLAQKEKLEMVYSQVNDPKYIEQQARQQLRMIKPGEILYVLPSKDHNKSQKTTGGGIIPK